MTGGPRSTETPTARSPGQAVGALDATTRSIMPSAGVVHLHLLRHGEVEGFARRSVRGHRDVPLSAAGLRQHERLASWFRRCEARPDRILCSDLSRCRHLGERLAAELDVPLVVEPRLREQHMGEWEGRTWEAITAEHGRAISDFWDRYAEAAPPGGESLTDAAGRITDAWSEHIADADGARLAVVTHIGVIRVLLCRALGLPLSEALRFAPPAASHTSLVLADAGAVVHGIGERPWLVATDETPPPLGPAPRLALSGSAGVGKTTLGRALADELGVPFLEEGMRARLESGLSLHALDRTQMRELLEELWREQQEAERAAVDGFVADRSAADYAAFWIHYGFHHDVERTESWLARSFQSLRSYDRVLLLPWGVLPLHDDGVRSTNRWLQFMFQSIVEGLLTQQLPEERLMRVPPTDDLSARLAFVVERLGAPQG